MSAQEYNTIRASGDKRKYEQLLKEVYCVKKMKKFSIGFI